MKICGVGYTYRAEDGALSVPVSGNTTILAMFPKTMPELAIHAGRRYWVVGEWLEPCTQEEYDNWILEQELTQ